MDNVQIEKILRLIVKEHNTKHNVKLCVVSQKHRTNAFTIALTIMTTTLMDAGTWPTMDEIYNIGEVIVKETDLVFSYNKERAALGTISLYDNEFDKKISEFLLIMVTKCRQAS